ncbi:uncharacterized protein LOC114524652 [Dendronephthya gigantea]|uniref:uncharacterized protein LOC114524652 n=1 Tax=Dendronephthya gigantea TaxID=151771 RepID=UPI00106C25B0|nr:uncharacterized protein LOC114524652 [Dendronephthya gigantea]XP_028401599.1 uncharacterized protein LOC114524652 [Dendronephthya gigantea]XP_028401600.1 uncharacterized protein LOC114524652 [Dendronephthya gigantea]XP_028401601.1 uncharacterized protein LOC114524652 [Dendronephthya gigantea]
MATYDEKVAHMKEKLSAELEKRKKLRKSELFVLDNSLRESTVGQLRGHTLENKWKIYEEVKKIGYQHIIVASFSHMTRLGDKFCIALKEAGEDFSKLYAFSEFVESIDKDRVPNVEKLPIGLVKMRELGIRHAIIEFDLVYKGIDYKKFTVKDICSLMKKRMEWCRSELAENSNVLFNFRDFSDAMRLKPKRVLKVVKFLSSLPEDERPFAIIYEESGKNLPEELGVWTAAIRQEMDDNGWTENAEKKGHLLVHVHEQWGLANMTQIECIVNGATGIWASLCEEGASMGHACSTLALMNMIRMGNKKVLRQYKGCAKLREAAQNVTQITTGLPPHPKQPVYGERALDMVFGMPNFAPDKKEFSMAEFFGEKMVMRMTTLASPQMVVDRLTNLFGKHPQFTLEIGKAMLEKMLEDLRNGRKEEYMSKVGLAILFDRSGGELTAAMRDAIAEEEPKSLRAKELLDDIRKMWDEWDLRDEVQGDDKLEFDSFYNGFMAPYFGCYRCDESKRALKAIDMDEDGSVDWNEFALYLRWAAREYPNAKDAEELLSIAFRKGLIPAMQDVVLAQDS